MRKALFLMFLAILFSVNSNAQNRLRYSEYGFGIGTLNYSGDVGTTTNISALLTEMRPNLKVYGLKHFNDWFAIGANLSYGWVYSNDLNHTNVSRGFEFYTGITQVNALIEVNLIRYGKYHYDRKFGLYVQTGGGFLAYNPHISFNNLEPDDIILYPNSYSGTSFFFNMGMKFRTSYKGTLRLEAYFHSTGTDHIDGFEFIDDNSSNDIFGGLGISYSILVY